MKSIEKTLNEISKPKGQAFRGAVTASVPEIEQGIIGSDEANAELKETMSGSMVSSSVGSEYAGSSTSESVDLTTVGDEDTDEDDLKSMVDVKVAELKSNHSNVSEIELTDLVRDMDYLLKGLETEHRDTR